MLERYLRFLVLILAILLLPSSVNAQTAASARLDLLDLDQFPIVSAYLDVRDGQGSFVFDLNRDQVMVSEDGVELNLMELNQERVGAQIVVALNIGTSLAIRDSLGFTRYDYLSDYFESWAASYAGQPQGDDLSLVTQSGIGSGHRSDAAEWLSAWQSYEPPLETASPSLEVLSSALDLVSDPTPNPGMGRVILFITPIMQTDQMEVLQNLADRARETGVRIFVLLVDSTALFESEFSEQFSSLALQTGGEVFTYSGVEPLPDLNLVFESSRYVYRFSYHSQISAAGQHNLRVVANSDLGEILTDEIIFDLQLRPPNPIFVSMPSQVVRSIPQDAEISVENLVPREFGIEILIEFPDTIQREIVSSRLYANEELVAENTSAPWEYFTIDLTQFESSEQILLRLEAQDEIGLVGSSLEIPLQITIQKPAQGFLPTLGRNIPVIAGIVVLGAGGVLVLILILSGNIRPRKIGEKRGRTKKDKNDPVTQPVEEMDDPPQKTENRLSRFARNLPAPKVRWPQLKSNSEPIAFLERIEVNGEKIENKYIIINTQEITIGSDPSQATVSLDEPSVDELHTRLWMDGDGSFRVADQNSTAGTWLNYAPVTGEGSQVHHGDLLHIAKVCFRFNLNNPSRQRQPLVSRENPDR